MKFSSSPETPQPGTEAARHGTHTTGQQSIRSRSRRRGRPHGRTHATGVTSFCPAVSV